MPKTANFSHKLTQLIEPSNGGELLALEDAAWLVGDLQSWRQARPHWQYATDLLLKAAQTGQMNDIEAVTAQMLRALSVEGSL